ncbi:EF-hand domain-containing protein [Myxococcus stipitatus]|uniref:EF-hand domain-containing protein n=1 Tax=Myxococcus stipitatus TaxID=83455 RepID=UPI00314523E2
MATKKRKSSAAKKSSRRASTAKKPAAKKSAARKATAKKAATRKSAAKKGSAKKSPATKKGAARKSAAKKGAARKSTPARKKSATSVRGGKKAASASTPRTARLPAPRETPAPVEVSIVAWAEPVEEDTSAGEQVETSSAGLQPLAPEHAAVDELTSSGNELLDTFQRYDRNRTGAIERAEFARLLEALGQDVTDEELEIALDIVDTDKTGRISWSEFKVWWNSR